MEISFRRVKHEIWQPDYSRESTTLQRIVAASGENPDENRGFTMPSRRTIVANVNGLDVGFSVTDYIKDDEYNQIAIFVDIKYQRLGIGGALFERITTATENLGITVSVRNNESILRFFEKRGFLLAYTRYWSQLSILSMIERVNDWLSTKALDEFIILEKSFGDLNNINQEVIDFIDNYNQLMISKTSSDLEQVTREKTGETKWLFDCTEIYTARVQEKIVGMAVASTWDDDLPTIEFLHVNENLSASDDFLMRMLLLKQFLSNDERSKECEVFIDANSLNPKTLSLLSYLADGLPNGRLVYARRPNNQ